MQLMCSMINDRVVKLLKIGLFIKSPAAFKSSLLTILLITGSEILSSMFLYSLLSFSNIFIKLLARTGMHWAKSKERITNYVASTLD